MSSSNQVTIVVSHSPAQGGRRAKWRVLEADR